MAEWSCSGLQIRPRRFDSDLSLQIKIIETFFNLKLFKLFNEVKLFLLARVVELVDTRDLKSLEGDFVPVQVRPRVPNQKPLTNSEISFFAEDRLSSLRSFFRVFLRLSISSIGNFSSTAFFISS